MADSLREQIFAEVAAQLALIKPENGYETSIGAGAFRWRVTEIGSEELPCHTVSDPESKTSNEVSRIHSHDTTFEVAAFDLKPEAIRVDQQGRKMLADLWKAIGVDRTWGGLAIDTLPVGDEMTVEHTDRTYVGVKVKFRVLYRTLRFDPYTQA